MLQFNRRRAFGSACIGLLCAFGPAALAQDVYPAKPIKIVVPFAAGGGVDILTRIVAEHLGDRLGQRVIVDPRPGAGGTIGVQAVASAPPDGYALVMATTGTHAINPGLYRKLPYDPVADFEPITTIALAPNLLVVDPALPVESVGDLIALARSKPGALNFGSFGLGTSNYLSGELLKQFAGIDIVHVPYRKAPDAVTDLMSGRIQLLFVNTPLGLPHVEAGKMRALAVTGAKRSPIAPELPTMIEAGVPDFVVESWYGLFAPAGTSREIIEKVRSEVTAILDRADVKSLFAKQGVETFATTPNELAAMITMEIPKWKRIIHAANVSID